MVASQSTDVVDVTIRPATLVPWGELQGMLIWEGFYRDMVMLADSDGRRTILGLDVLAEEYSSFEYDILKRLDPADAFRIGMEWAWQRQNATMRSIVETLQDEALTR